MASTDGSAGPTFWDIHNKIGELHAKLAECFQAEVASPQRSVNASDLEEVWAYDRGRRSSDDLQLLTGGQFPRISREVYDRGRRSSDELQSLPGVTAPSRIFTDSSVSGVGGPEATPSARMMGTPMSPNPAMFGLVPTTPQTPAMLGAVSHGRSVTTGHTPNAGSSRNLSTSMQSMSMQSMQQGLAWARSNKASRAAGSPQVPKPVTAELPRMGTLEEPMRPERIETGTKIGRHRRQSLQEELAVFQNKFDDDRKVAQQNFAKMEKVVSKKIGLTVMAVSEKSRRSDSNISESDKFGSEEEECEFQIRQCFEATSDRPKRLSMQARGGDGSKTQTRFEVSETEKGKSCFGCSDNRFIITPGSKVRAVSDAFRMLCVILDIILIPLEQFELQGDMSTMRTIGWLTLAFWTLDILAQFRTAYFEKGGLVVDPWQIAWHYLKRWLIFDVTVVTLDFVLEATDVSSSATLSLLRMIRVGRLLKWNQMFASIRENIDSQIWITRMSILNILCQILLMYHVVACSYWGLGRINFESENWINEYGLADRTFAYQYTTTLHWAVCQLGLGSNKIEATNFAERVFCIVIVLVALVTFSSLVSLMTNQLTILHNAQEEEQQQFRLLRSFLLRNHIPPSLSQRVTKFLQHSYTIQREAISDSQVPLLTHLSKNLFGELQFARYQRSLTSMAFVEALLEGQNLQNFTILHDMATQVLSQSVLAKNEVVFYAGNLAEHCFVAATGLLEYCQGRESTKVSVDRWVAEMCLFTPWSYVGDLFTEELSILVSMNMEGFCECVCKAPDTQLQARKFAKIYVDHMKMDQTSSDLWTLPGSEDDVPSSRVGDMSPKNYRKSTPSRLWIQNLFGSPKRRTSVRRVSLLPDPDEIAQLQELQQDSVEVSGKLFIDQSDADLRANAEQDKKRVEQQQEPVAVGA